MRAGLLRAGVDRHRPYCRGVTVRTARWFTVLDVQVPLSGRYESAGEVSAPERLVRRFGDLRTV